MTELADRPTATTRAIGQSIRRKEDDRLVTGATNWTDNIQLPGALHMAFVRSPHAHAKITRVDLTAARAMPGVVTAFDAAGLGDANPKVLCVWGVVEGTVMPDFPALASGEVRYAGDCVAVVLATDHTKASTLRRAVVIDGPALFLQGTILVLSVLAVLTMAERFVGNEGDAFTSQGASVPGSAYEAATARAGSGSPRSSARRRAPRRRRPSRSRRGR